MSLEGLVVVDWHLEEEESSIGEEGDERCIVILTERI